MECMEGDEKRGKKIPPMETQIEILTQIAWGEYTQKKHPSFKEEKSKNYAHQTRKKGRKPGIKPVTGGAASESERGRNKKQSARNKRSS